MSNRVAMGVSVEGIEEVVQELERRGANVRRELRRVVMKGARIIQQDAKARTNSRRVRSALVVKSLGGTGSTVNIGVGPAKRRAPHAHLLEFGVARHEIKPRAGNQRGLRLHGGRWVKNISHPGHAAHPFLGPALEANRERAQDAIAAEFRKVIES